MFSRGRGSGRHARDERTGRGGRTPAGVPADDATPAAERGYGPYDVAEAPAGVERLDLGSLQIPAVADVEVRVQANPDGAVQQVVLVDGENALQLGVFAAPRSAGIWDDVREEIRASLFDEGVAAQETDGEYGVELRARVRTPDGGLTDLRFIGVDGPRWMVRGVFQGPAATDPARAARLLESLRGLVVDRGLEAKPVREPLPLRLPRDAADRALAEQGGAPVTLAPPVNGAVPPVPSTPPSGPPEPEPPSAGPRRRPSPRPRR